MTGDGEASAARELADRFWDELLELEPILATDIGDDRFDDRLPDPSEAGLERRREFYSDALDQLAKLDLDAVGVEMRGTLAILEFAAKRQLDDIEFRLDRLGAATHIWGPASLLADIATVQPADTPERVDRYVTRLRAMGGFFDEISRIVLESADVGMTVPGLIADRTIAQIERLLEMPPEGSPAVMPVPEDHADDRQRVADAVRDVVWPAHRRYLEALREYRPKARDTIGMSALPNGDAMYESQIRGFTTLPLGAQEVHDIGLADLEKIQEDRREISKGLGFATAEEALEDVVAKGKDRASSREEIIRLAEDQVQRSWDAAPGWFGHLPSANCVVKPVEEFREGDMPAAYYLPPSIDGSRQGVYWINTGGIDQRPLHDIAAITYHEANPGHHFQIAIEFEFADRPPIRRFGGILAGSAFAEGWGLYSERLADEMGLYLDEYERLGMLAAQGWRAARLIVDSGIHALGWDRQRAIDTMVEAGVAPMNAEVETDRYISMPGQALAYKVGQHEIERWRSEAQRREGSSFSLRDFHDRLLALGSLPLPALQRELGAS